MQIKHSKYKNTGILFELLVRQITNDVLEGKDSPAKDLLKKYFVKTELGKEYKLYEALLKKTTLTETKANVILSTLLESSKTLNRGIIKRQKYNLISEIQKNYDLNEFFNHKLPNYKTHAAFYTLIEINNLSSHSNHEQVINNKITILEHLTAAPIKEDKLKDEVITEAESLDRDTKFLTYKIILEKFNEKYDSLNLNQKTVLKEYINSVDNTSRLKDFYSGQINEIKNKLSILNKKTKNKITQIKINEIINIIPTPTKNTKVTDNDLVDLLQYYDLVNELETVNE